MQKRPVLIAAEVVRYNHNKGNMIRPSRWVQDALWSIQVDRKCVEPLGFSKASRTPLSRIHNAISHINLKRCNGMPWCVVSCSLVNALRPAEWISASLTLLQAWQPEPPNPIGRGSCFGGDLMDVVIPSGEPNCTVRSHFPCARNPKNYQCSSLGLLVRAQLERSPKPYSFKIVSRPQSNLGMKKVPFLV